MDGKPAFSSVEKYLLTEKAQRQLFGHFTNDCELNKMAQLFTLAY